MLKIFPTRSTPKIFSKHLAAACLFIYNIMDEVQYNDRGNRLTMVKKKSRLRS